ncbi:MAG: S8/S53 family peptidase [Vicinamibacteria bacterium]
MAVSCSAPQTPPSSKRTVTVALHFDDLGEASRAGDNLARSGEERLCDIGDEQNCMELAPAIGSPGIVYVRPAAIGSGDGVVLSVGDAFDEAYELRERSGARRAEPLLRVAIPRAQAASEIDALDVRSSGGSGHDPRAASDPLWALKQVKVPDAWVAIRDKWARAHGEEARGIVIAHPDTGYLPHAEIWSVDESASPIWQTKGYDYVDGDDDPVDELLDEEPLDNPAHGTGAASAIVSPAGCQLPLAGKCPTGPALGARIVPLRVDRSVVVLDTERLSWAIRDASGSDRSRVRVDTQVMSISMGGVASWTLWRAVKSAEERGYLIVAAAGNYVSKVVWPARFSSVIAVAATNVGCRPWAHSSFGSSVDVSAPGESVWRASLGEDGAPGVVMSKGTTFSTATVAGVAALWLVYHADSDELRTFRERGELTHAFRTLVKATAWKPGTEGSAVPCDENATWNDFRYGAGIVDAATLLLTPLEGLVLPQMLAPERLEELPLWTSLYPEETSAPTVSDDYRRLFGLPAGDDIEPVAIFEAEILHHYAVSDAVSTVVDAVVIDGGRDDEAFVRIREALRSQELSTRLRGVLPQ